MIREHLPATAAGRLVRRRLMTAIVLVMASAQTPAVASDVDAMALLRSGDAVALMRHALAPGTGDPAHFQVNDCRTQRNLSAAGRAQARRIGVWMSEAGIAEATVLSSAWCRCLETARLLALGTPSVFEPLNSFFTDRAVAATRTDGLRRFIRERLTSDAAANGASAVMVTHQVNITRLTGVFPASGDVLIIGLDDSGQPTVLDQRSTEVP